MKSEMMTATLYYIFKLAMYMYLKLVCLYLYLGEQWSFLVGFFIIDSHIQTAH